MYRVNLELRYFGRKVYLTHTVAYDSPFPHWPLDGYLPGTPYMTLWAHTADYTCCCWTYRVNLELRYFGHKVYLTHTVDCHSQFPHWPLDGYLPGTPYMTLWAHTADYTSCCWTYRVNIELRYFGHKVYLTHTVAYDSPFPHWPLDGYLPGTPYLT